jgi:hypothetical protein
VAATHDKRVRPIVESILRRNTWRYKFLCYDCLLNLTLERLGMAYTESEVRTALSRIFKKPGAFAYMYSFPCAKCDQAVACLSGTVHLGR